MDILTLFISVVAAVVAQSLHLLWYSTATGMGKAWRTALKKKADAKIPTKMSIISFTSLVVSSLIYGFFVSSLGMSAGIDFVIFTVLMFIAFTIPSKVMSVIFMGQPRRLILIDGGFYLIAYALFGLAHYLF
ncbi:MAG: hypothetical protein CMH30_07070 [Micavibrio sp.]|nr:hypothetical protein [Micavibrio sp.]|tara:strand:- start:2304 stop:2699 length:396 start_codon:yes stop_codon:yes gene_type:complete